MIPCRGRRPSTAVPFEENAYLPQFPMCAPFRNFQRPFGVRSSGRTSQQHRCFGQAKPPPEPPGRRGAVVHSTRQLDLDFLHGDDTWSLGFDLHDVIAGSAKVDVLQEQQDMSLQGRQSTLGSRLAASVRERGGSPLPLPIASPRAKSTTVDPTELWGLMRSGHHEWKRRSRSATNSMKSLRFKSQACWKSE